ncbi:MAG: hypothetical protein R3C56_19560 [Pirellulaceae bacterium]
MQPLFDDERPMVQLQLLLTLAGYTTAGQATEVGEVAEFAEEQMAAILVAHPDPVFRAAAVSGLQGRELEMLRRLQASDRWTGEHEDGCGAVDMLAMCVVHEAVPQRVEQLPNWRHRRLPTRRGSAKPLSAAYWPPTSTA